MITQTAFVRANSVVVLDTITHVGLNVTLVIYPSDAELANTIGDTQTLDKVSLLELRVLVVLFLDGGKYLTYGLDVLRLVGKSLFQILYNFFSVSDPLQLLLHS